VKVLIHKFAFSLLSWLPDRVVALHFFGDVRLRSFVFKSLDAPPTADGRGLGWGVGLPFGPRGLMIDLHSHILPGIDDGARDVGVSLAMARMWVADGVEVVAATPHILPGLYHNTGPEIRAAVARLQAEIDAAGLPLQIVTGSDAHIVADFAGQLRSGHLLSIADTRYVLVELPHHVAPQRLEDAFFSITLAGYVPILTHPERCTWIRAQYPTMRRLVDAGVWMQITAGSLTGAFGREPRFIAERMLDEGLVHILASDAHDTERRPPLMARGREAAARRVGDEEATHLVFTRPAGILRNEAPARLPVPAPAGAAGATVRGERNEQRAERPSRRAGGAAHAMDGPPHDGGDRTLAHRLRRLFTR